MDMAGNRALRIQDLQRKLKAQRIKYQEGKPVLVSITKDQLMDMFPEDRKLDVLRIFEAPGVDAMVVFINDNKKSKEFGSVAAIKVGPQEVVRSLEDCVGRFIGEPTLGTEKVAMFYCSKGGETASLN